MYDRRVFERIAHARLRGEMQYRLRFCAFEDALQARRVRDVELVEAKRDAQLLQAVALELHRVVRREVVDAHDLVAARAAGAGRNACR